MCPECGTNTGKKTLSQRVHRCDCGAVMNRDIAAAKVIQQRGNAKVASSEVSSEACDDRAVGHTVVNQIACRGDATGVQQKR